MTVRKVILMSPLFIKKILDLFPTRWQLGRKSFWIQLGHENEVKGL